MKGKWQTVTVRHNNNTSHDAAVMRTIKGVCPRQPQQYESETLHRHETFHIAKLHPSMFSSLWVFAALIGAPAESMYNSVMSANSQTERGVQERHHLCATLNSRCDLVALGETVLHPNTH